jgi:hypothetical protein
MTPPPLPDVPCVRVRLIWSDGGTLRAGSRFYLSYAGSAPTGANCTTLASDIAAAWGTNIAPMVNGDSALVEVDVLDIGTNSGLSGQWSGSTPGTRAGTDLPLQVATNVEFGIARRYRGGKPRWYQPHGVEADLATQSTWSSAYVSANNSAVTAMFTAVEALSIGAMGALRHVNLSFYSSFTNHTGTSGRAKAVPTYRASALHDNITGYSTKVELGSQRRRRTSTS